MRATSTFCHFFTRELGSLRVIFVKVLQLEWSDLVDLLIFLISGPEFGPDVRNANSISTTFMHIMCPLPSSKSDIDFCHFLQANPF